RLPDRRLQPVRARHGHVGLVGRRPRRARVDLVLRHAPGGLGGGGHGPARDRGPHRLPPLAALVGRLPLPGAGPAGGGADPGRRPQPERRHPLDRRGAADHPALGDRQAGHARLGGRPAVPAGGAHAQHPGDAPAGHRRARRGRHAGDAPAQPGHDAGHAGIALSLCFVGGTPAGPLAGWTTLGLGAAVAAALAAPYRRDRVLAFLDPWADPMDRGYQNIQSLVGIANGGLFGTGLGASRAKWGYLPLAHSDFIFAIVGEELGLIGATVVIGLFGLLAIIGVRIALHAPDRFGLLLAVGVTAWLCIQAFVNIGAVIGILPITGVPLPFVSAGGSSLVVAMAGAGLLLSVARQATVRSLPPRPPERAR